MLCGIPEGKEFLIFCNPLKGTGSQGLMDRRIEELVSHHPSDITQPAKSTKW